ncbi:transposable element Tc3 transposase [Trichonephila clavipes]|nr:transposable element Tc3 transposase [Trichonephila clavipes]
MSSSPVPQKTRRVGERWALNLSKIQTSSRGVELWFQQDGATCHTACATIDLLKDTFGDRVISRFGPVNWPPRFCDLTPLDNFLWGYVNSLVYADKPQTLDHLEDNIRRVIADIRPQMLEKVIENWTSRLDYIRASRGSHMPEIIFKISFAFKNLCKNVLFGPELVASVSRARILVSLNIRRVGKDTDACSICRYKSPSVIVMWLLREGIASSGVVLVT